MDPSWAWRRSSSIAARCVSYHYAQLVWVDVCHNWFYHIKKDHQKNQVFWWPIGRYTIRQPCLEPSPRFQEIHEDTHQSIIWFGDELLASELTLEAYFSLSLFNIGVLRHGSSHLNLSINKLFGWRISIATFDSTSLYVVCFAWFHVKDQKKKEDDDQQNPSMLPWVFGAELLRDHSGLGNPFLSCLHHFFLNGGHGNKIAYLGKASIFFWGHAS